MHNNKIGRHFSRRAAHFLECACGFLSLCFWAAALFGFDDPVTSAVTLLAVFLHEAGHLAALWLLGHPLRLPSPRLSGFGIRARRVLSYKEEFFVCLAGPLANLITGGVVLLFSRGEASLFFAVSLLTAASNLLPIRGYDGYKAILAISGGLGFTRCEEILSYVSFVLGAAALLLSLYAIYRLNAGYWIFGVFFIFILKEVKISIGERFSRF